MIELDCGAPTCIGVLNVAEFALARSMIADLAAHADYDDWLDMREGLQIGLAMAGLDARIVQIDFGSFLTWCDERGYQLSEKALDAFAAVIWFRSSQAISTLN